MHERYKQFLAIGDSHEKWLLVQSPYHTLSIMVVYLFFVLYLGPKIMAKRPAYQLKFPLALYNIYQIGFNLWLLHFAWHPDSLVLFTNCYYFDLTGFQQYFLSYLAWWFYFSKLVDLIDTVFFVLRKKHSQVTFLHVYHHAHLILLGWVYNKYYQNGQAMVIATINVFVHVIMYTYYLLSTLDLPPQYLRWKKYLTTMQLMQFVVDLIYVIYIVTMKCTAPKPLVCFYLIDFTLFIYLFARFYKNTYKGKE